MVTVHEAIKRVLTQRGSLPAPAIADEINTLGLYTRGDGAPVPPNQIHARFRHHPDVFLRADGIIHLVRATTLKPPPSAGRPTRRKPSVPSATKDQDFFDLGMVGELIKNGLPNDRRLEQCGVYWLTVPKGYVPQFIDPDEVRRAKNVIHPWDVDRLRSKCVLNTNVVYIGLAADRTPRSLRERLNDLLEHVRGHTTEQGPHKGGEIVWQLRDHHQFRLCAVQTDAPPAPRETEEMLLRMFKDKYGKLPFANRRSGSVTS